MSAYHLQATRALMDQLMGKHRNLDESEKPKSMKYTDEDVCKYFICGFCPHDLFSNTKSDLGPCENDHDEKMKVQFQATPDSEKQSYMRRFVRFLETLEEEANARVRRASIRFEAPVPSEGAALIKGPEYMENFAKLEGKREQVKTLEQQMTALGEEGKVSESQALLKLTESLNLEIQTLEFMVQEKDTRMVESTQQRMRACEVCGIFTSNNPEDSRAQSHLLGKQHMGFAKIRAFLIENRKWLHVRREPEKIAHKRDTEEPARERSPRRERSRERGRRDRSRSRDRGRRDGERDRDRSRRDDRDRGRDRDRDRRRR